MLVSCQIPLEHIFRFYNTCDTSNLAKYTNNDYLSNPIKAKHKHNMILLLIIQSNHESHQNKLILTANFSKVSHERVWLWSMSVVIISAET